MKLPSTDDTHVPVRAYLTDETFGYEHWRATQFSAPDAEVQRWAILSLYPTKDARDTALSSLLGGAAPLQTCQTCKFWSRLDGTAEFDTDFGICVEAVRRFDGLVAKDFGCTLHQPVASPPEEAK